MSNENEINVNFSNDDDLFINLFDGTNPLHESLEPLPKSPEIDKNYADDLLGLGLDAHSEIQENISNQYEEEPSTGQLADLQPVPVQSLRDYDLPFLGAVDADSETPKEIPDFDADLEGNDIVFELSLPSSPFFQTGTTNDLLEIQVTLPPQPEPTFVAPEQEPELEESQNFFQQEAVETELPQPQQRKRKSSHPIITDIGNMDLSISARSNLRDDAMRQNTENKSNMENFKRTDTVVSPGTMKAPSSKGRQKKIKMHQLEDVNDPKVKRAKMARENREKKKQAEMELTDANAKLADRVEELTRDLEKCRGTINDLGRANISLQQEKEEWIAEREELKASLQKEIDRNEKLEADLNKDVATPEQTVKIIDNFTDIVKKLPNKCEIEVKPTLAEMRVPVMSNEMMAEIRHGQQSKVPSIAHRPSSTSTPTRVLKFTGVFDLEEKASPQSRTELMTMMVPDTDDDQSFH
ncbi:hypothetical protein Ocin01_01780 [Orchesella cincta]|uniref:BZIP domain-containing protein n=1 Tax=Orchesella cincta TaxID=48709 RepID=A0A1D2NHY9_ORCCI|nr:hypothetical protein Ocin01_01780 [Orchesella cincta]